MARHVGAGRRGLFETLSRPALKRLRAVLRVHVERDRHVEIAKHHHKIPHGLLKRKLCAQVTTRTVETSHENRRGAAPVRTADPRPYPNPLPQAPLATPGPRRETEPSGRHGSERIWRRRWTECTGPHTNAPADPILGIKTQTTEGVGAASAASPDKVLWPRLG